MEKISWTNRVRNAEVIQRIRDRNILGTINRRKANWIPHLLCRNCLLQDVTKEKIEGRIEVMGRRGRRSKELLDDVKEKRGYCKLKEKALYRTLWRTCCGAGYGHVLRQNAE